MARLRLCRACGAFHDIAEPWPMACVGDPTGRMTRSDLPCPAIRADGMDAITSMADGKTYDSRSAYYASVREAGCEIVGDDRAGFGRAPTADDIIPGDAGRDIADTIQELSARAA